MRLSLALVVAWQGPRRDNKPSEGRCLALGEGESPLCFHCSSVTLCRPGSPSPPSSPSMSAQISFFPPLSSLFSAFLFFLCYSLGCFSKNVFKKPRSHTRGRSTLTRRRRINLEQRSQTKVGIVERVRLWNNVNQPEESSLTQNSGCLTVRPLF